MAAVQCGLAGIGRAINGATGGFGAAGTAAAGTGLVRERESGRVDWRAASGAVGSARRAERARP
jgi:hypothetical protein